MRLVDNIIFALVSGLTEFLPVSSAAHELLLMKFFGQDSISPLLRFSIHLGILVALLVCSKGQITRLRREQQMLSVPKHRRKRQIDVRAVMDLRLLKGATPMVVVGILLTQYARQLVPSLGFLSVFLVLNGILLYIPRHMSGGSKDSRNLSQADALLMGIFSAAAVTPGLSRIAGVLCISAVRGTERQTAWYFSLLLTIPAIIAMLVMDLVGVVLSGVGIVTVMVVISLFFAAAAAFAGAYLGIWVMQNLASTVGYSGFAYYSWGVALFSLILHLTIS